MKKRVYSAMRPTGELHIGHYFGAVKNWIKMQEEYDCFFAVADWHALTTNYDNPENIKEMRRQMVLSWLAAGLDVEKAPIFIQSHNLYTAELYLLLGMFTPVSWLERCPSYKDMINTLSHKDLSNYGFLGYPVLMTADIIMYLANLVPVGVDQVPHVELAREIVRRFNNFYGEIFVEPESMLTNVPKLPGLDGRKMSKSLNNTILLTEDADIIEKKIKIEMKIQKNRKNRYRISEKIYYEGYYRKHQKGFGFVKITEQEEEIYIAKEHAQNALNGDRVLIEITEEKNKIKKAEGKIVKILKHEKDTIVGIFQNNKTFGFVVPDDKNFGTDIYIAKKNFGKARSHHKVLVKITKYPKKEKKVAF